MRYCARCCYPENTKPSILFDDDGVCSGCRTFETRAEKSDEFWKEKRKELGLILEEYKEKARKLGSPYDCVLPVGGGKDSHYQAHVLTQEFKMRPLLVTYNHSYNTKVGIRNLTNIVEKFGLDMLRFTTNPKSAKKLSRYMLKKVGDITWHYHAGILTLAYAGPTWWLWKQPTLAEITYIIGIAILMSAVQYCIIRGYKEAEASAAQPLEYVRILYLQL